MLYRRQFFQVIAAVIAAGKNAKAAPICKEVAKPAVALPVVKPLHLDGLTMVKGPTARVNIVDVTSHCDDGWRSFMVADPSVLDFTFMLNSKASEEMASKLYQCLADRNVQAFTIDTMFDMLPRTYNFRGIVYSVNVLLGHPDTVAHVEVKIQIVADSEDMVYEAQRPIALPAYRTVR